MYAYVYLYACVYVRVYDVFSVYFLTWKETEWQICPHLTVIFMGTPLHTSSYSSLSNLKMASLRLWVLQCLGVAKLWRKISVTDCLPLHMNSLWVNGAFLFSSCSESNGTSCVLNNFRLSCTHRCASQVSGGSLAMEEQNPSVGTPALLFPSEKTTQGKLWPLCRRKGLMGREWTQMKVCLLL